MCSLVGRSLTADVSVSSFGSMRKRSAKAMAVGTPTSLMRPRRSLTLGAPFVVQGPLSGGPIAVTPAQCSLTRFV